MRAKIILVLLIIGLCWYVKGNDLHMNPNRLLNDGLKEYNKTSEAMIKRIENGYADYFCRVDGGFILVTGYKSGLLWGDSSIEFIDDKTINNNYEMFKDVYYRERHPMRESVTYIYGMCRKKGTVRVCATDAEGDEMSYKVVDDLFCVRVNDSSTAGAKLCGLNDKNEVIWTKEFPKDDE